jgi:hypothetical protein
MSGDGGGRERQTTASSISVLSLFHSLCTLFRHSSLDFYRTTVNGMRRLLKDEIKRYS